MVSATANPATSASSIALSNAASSSGVAASRISGRTSLAICVALESGRLVSRSRHRGHRGVVGRQDDRDEASEAFKEQPPVKCVSRPSLGCSKGYPPGASGASAKSHARVRAHEPCVSTQRSIGGRVAQPRGLHAEVVSLGDAGGLRGGPFEGRDGLVATASALEQMGACRVEPVVPAELGIECL
jgi:hypothetical protein